MSNKMLGSINTKFHNHCCWFHIETKDKEIILDEVYEIERPKAFKVDIGHYTEDDSDYEYLLTVSKFIRKILLLLREGKIAKDKTINVSFDNGYLYDFYPTDWHERWDQNGELAIAHVPEVHEVYNSSELIAEIVQRIL